MSFDTNLKRVSHRDWRTIQLAWLSSLPNLPINNPGTPPADNIEDLLQLDEAFKKVPKDGATRVLTVPGLNAAMLHEGLYILQKSANVLTASQSQVNQGLPTWSIPTAYQSAFFSMEALLLILGVSIVKKNNRTMIVDVWPTVEDRASKREKSTYTVGSEVHLLNVPEVQHYHRWALLKRALRTLSNSPVDGAFINAIDSIDEKDFARQRNHLHYRTTWTFNDIHSFCSDLEYCRFAPTQSVIDNLDPEDKSFCVSLACLLFDNAIALLRSIAVNAPIIQNELNYLEQACDSSRMPLLPAYEIAMTKSVF